jgi:trigger factor
MAPEANTDPSGEDPAEETPQAAPLEEQELVVATADDAAAETDKGEADDAAAETDKGEADVAVAEDETDEDEDQLLSLDVEVNEPSACERHVVVKIAPEDIDRYKDDAYEEMMPTAQVPGFRPGRAPRKLVEKRFRGEVNDQVKGSLVMDAITQVSEAQDYSAISEPDFDFDAVQLEDEGPLVFEFTVEVRPEFDMPEWQGLKLKRVSHEYSDEEVQKRTRTLLQRYGTLEPHDGPVEKDDLVTVTIVCSDGEEEISRLEDARCPVRSKLVFRDGEIDGFEELVTGAAVNATLEVKAAVSKSHENEELQGKSLDAVITIEQIERNSLPELTDKFLGEVGDFESVEEMHDAVREELERQLEYHREQQIRGQITELLTESANWELPPTLLKRQSQRELQRSILELQSSGFSDDEIRMYINRIQQDLLGSTAKSLKEHFILERIAEDNELDVTPQELDLHIELLARQQNVSTRRIRAREEKRGGMDALRNQIVERKAIGLINEHAEFTDVPLEETDEEESFAISHDIAGEPPSSEATGMEPAVAKEKSKPEAKESRSDIIMPDATRPAEDKEEATSEDTPAEDKGEATSEDTPAEDKGEAASEDTPAEDKEEAASEDTPAEDKEEAASEDTPAEDKEEATSKDTPAEDKEEATSKDTPAEDKEEATSKDTPAEDKEEAGSKDDS